MKKKQISTTGANAITLTGVAFPLIKINDLQRDEIYYRIQTKGIKED